MFEHCKRGTEQGGTALKAGERLVDQNLGGTECQAFLADDISELCRTSEDLTTEDKVAELLPITVQHLYVLVKQDRLEEAESLVKEISLNEYVKRTSLNYQSHRLTLRLQHPRTFNKEGCTE